MNQRSLFDHVIVHSGEDVRVTVLDEPGAGGGHHHYKIGHPGTAADGQGWSQHIMFQNGPIPEAGVNGVTHEALLAVLIDRLRCFQAGPFACRQNALALTKLEEGLMWLHARTHERAMRGVEGTHQP